MMFTVVKKESADAWEGFSVYAVRDDVCGYPQFLIYDDGAWKWMSAKNFIPVEEIEE